MIHYEMLSQWSSGDSECRGAHQNRVELEEHPLYYNFAQHLGELSLSLHRTLMRLRSNGYAVVWCQL